MTYKRYERKIKIVMPKIEGLNYDNTEIKIIIVAHGDRSSSDCIYRISLDTVLETPNTIRMLTQVLKTYYSEELMLYEFDKIVSNYKRKVEETIK